MYDPYTLNKLAQSVQQERIEQAQELLKAAHMDSGPSLKERLTAFAHRLVPQQAEPRPTHQTREIPVLR